MTNPWTATRIKALREQTGLTQAKFALALGVSRSQTIGAWENDHKRPSPLSCQALDRLAQQVQPQQKERLTT